MTIARIKIFLAAWAAIIVGSVAMGQANPPATTADQLPQVPGHHSLHFKTTLDNKPFNMPYTVFLPKDYDKRQVKRPMFIFLHGVGERGDDSAALTTHGPEAELNRNPKLADWADFIVLSPQCPLNKEWSDPGMARNVVSLLGMAVRTWHVDPSMVYVTGLSMGGRGCWYVAMEAKGAFAAIAPISSIEIEPDKVAKALAGNTSVWMIAGQNDPPCLDGSRKMLATLTKNKVDAVLTEIPGGDHFVWSQYYSNKRFYEIMMLHKKGMGPPKDRPDDKELLAIYSDPIKTMDARLATDFRKFLPWWTLLNCGSDMEVGLKRELDGHKNVFVTSPLNKQSPCKLLFTAKVPADKRTFLNMTVGRHPDGGWNLIVMADDREVLKKQISKLTSANGWVDVSVDLTRYAGRDVRLELINASNGGGKEAAYWAKVEITDTPPAATTEAVAQSRPAATKKTE